MGCVGVGDRGGGSKKGGREAGRYIDRGEEKREEVCDFLIARVYLATQ